MKCYVFAIVVAVGDDPCKDENDDTVDDHGDDNYYELKSYLWHDLCQFVMDI